MQRVPTGVRGLDDVLGGGVPQGSLVLLVGGPGAGKTTLCGEFLAQAARQGEPALLVLAGQSRAAFARAARPQGLLEAPGLALLDAAALEGASGPAGLARAVASAAAKAGARRVAVDSLSALLDGAPPGPAGARGFVSGLADALREAGCTTLAAVEAQPRGAAARHGAEEFAADGVIHLGELERQNDVVRTLQVAKMRGVEHARARFLLDITQQGISLAPLLRNVGSPHGPA